MTYNLFLDDLRVPTDCLSYMHNWIGQLNTEYYLYTEWVVVRTYDEFVTYITNHGLPTMASFDHDLGTEHQEYYHIHLEGRPWEEKQKHVYDYDSFKEKTGYSAAKWLVGYCLDNNLKLPVVVAHTANPVGRQNIDSIFASARKHFDI